MSKFGEAFAKNRKLLGAGKTFTWLKSEGGDGESYTTNFKEEEAKTNRPQPRPTDLGKNENIPRPQPRPTDLTPVITKVNNTVVTDHRKRPGQEAEEKVIKAGEQTAIAKMGFNQLQTRLKQKEAGDLAQVNTAAYKELQAKLKREAALKRLKDKYPPTPKVTTPNTAGADARAKIAASKLQVRGAQYTAETRRKAELAKRKTASTGGQDSTIVKYMEENKIKPKDLAIASVLGLNTPLMPLKGGVRPELKASGMPQDKTLAANSNAINYYRKELTSGKVSAEKRQKLRDTISLLQRDSKRVLAANVASAKKLKAPEVTKPAFSKAQIAAAASAANKPKAPEVTKPAFSKAQIAAAASAANKPTSFIDMLALQKAYDEKKVKLGDTIILYGKKVTLDSKLKFMLD